MRYLSVCSGIEAASVAWEPLGWEPAYFSEIEPFPSAVLHHHYGAGRPRFMPDPEGAETMEERRERSAAIKAVASLPLITTPGQLANLGDMTRFMEWPDDRSIQLLVGGTPCQGFSVAGFREGLADPRSNLMLTYLAIAAKYRTQWLVWENVPGALSTNGGRDFGALLWGLGQLGYGFAYRVLDAQHCRASSLPFAVPQRRRRVFVVGYLGDWRRAAAVLFDGTSLRGDPPPRREAGQIVAPTISARTKSGGGLGTDFDLDGGLISDVTGTLNSASGRGVPGDNVQDASAGMLIPEVSPAMKARDHKGVSSDGTGDGLPIIPVVMAVAHSLRAEGFDASEDGTGRGTPLVPIAFHGAQDPDVSGDVTHPLGRNQGQEVSVAIPFDSATVAAYTAVHQEWRVRRLMPPECCSLQGFQRDYLSQVTHRGKAPADGPMYKALGNSMATNVMEVIGERIALVDAL